MQQQIQQTGPFLELSYVWLPAASLLIPGQAQGDSDSVAQSKACISALAAAGYALAKQCDGTSQADGTEPGKRAAKPTDIVVAQRLPFGSPLGRSSHRSAVEPSSSSSAQFFNEAPSSLQPAASASLQTATLSTGQRSAAGENQAAHAAFDILSSVSGLVTPGKEQHGHLQEACIAKPEDTPGTSQLASSSAQQNLAWEGTILLDHTENDLEPRLSQSHPDGMPAPNQSQADPALHEESEQHTQQLQSSAMACQSHSHTAAESDTSWHLRQQPEPASDQPSVQTFASSPVALAEQPSDILCGESSAWSVQAPGALSAEPSGCWDGFPDALLPSDPGLPEDGCDPDPLPHQLDEAQPSVLGNMSNDQGCAEHAEPDLFSLGEFELELPPLDSPHQQAMPCGGSLSTGQTPARAGHEILQTESGPAECTSPVHGLNSEADAQLHSPVKQRVDASSLQWAAEPSHAGAAGSMTALMSSQEVSSNAVLGLVVGNANCSCH